jgi:hypothetical protein
MRHMEHGHRRSRRHCSLAGAEWRRVSARAHNARNARFSNGEPTTVGNDSEMGAKQLMRQTHRVARGPLRPLAGLVGGRLGSLSPSTNACETPAL